MADLETAKTVEAPKPDLTDKNRPKSNRFTNVRQEEFTDEVKELLKKDEACKAAADGATGDICLSTKYKVECAIGDRDGSILDVEVKLSKIGVMTAPVILRISATTREDLIDFAKKGKIKVASKAEGPISYEAWPHKEGGYI